MSMVLGLTQLNDATIERLVADPPLVWRILSPDDDEMYERAREEANRLGKPGIFSRLFGGAPALPPPASDEPPAFALAEGEGKESDLDKSWHGLHFLLTGSAEGGSPPLDFLLDGGRFVGNEEDVGYGPARVFTAAEVRIIATALLGLTDDRLKARFDPKAMEAKDIYPTIWITEGEEALDYVMDYVATLRGTIAEAVGTNRGLLVTLS